MRQMGSGESALPGSEMDAKWQEALTGVHAEDTRMTLGIFGVIPSCSRGTEKGRRRSVSSGLIPK